MPEKISITEFDVFFLSYDEPNAERHWAHLLDLCPWAKRVHGVKGFDAAHRACAEQSETDWFVTVDADNMVRSEFFDLTVEIDRARRPLQCWSWNGLNAHNGLQYGNGGIKLWSRAFVLRMNTHENADDPRKAVDFCWEDDYQQVHRTFSDVHVTGSPYQAFRVGFREGVKLTLDRGERVHAADMATKLHPINLRNARIWSCVGADVENGRWAMLGTRMGWAAMCDPSWDHTCVRDYQWFGHMWRGLVEDVFGGLDAAVSLGRVDKAVDIGDKTIDRLDQAIGEFGQRIAETTGIVLPSLDPATSGFFRDSLRLRND